MLQWVSSRIYTCKKKIQIWSNNKKILKNYPRFFCKEEGNEIGKEAELEKVKGVLSLFAKDKIHGPHGWSVEFFVHF